MLEVGFSTAFSRKGSPESNKLVCKLPSKHPQMEDAEKDAPILIFWDCLFSFFSMDVLWLWHKIF